MRFLRKSTAATVGGGPFLDKTDGVTPKTALASQAGRIIKNGTGSALSAPTTWSHDGNGHYLVGLGTGDTDTVGRLRIDFSDPATFCPVWEDFTVLDPAVYDVLFGSVAPSTHTVAAVADAVANRFGQPGTVTAATSGGSFSSSVAGSGLLATNGVYNNMWLKFNDGAANDSVPKKITSYTVASGTGTFTFSGSAGQLDEPFAATPGIGDTFLIIGRSS